MKLWKKVLIVLAGIAAALLIYLAAVMGFIDSDLKSAEEVADHLYEVEYTEWDEEWAASLAEVIAKRGSDDDADAEASADANASGASATQKKDASAVSDAGAQELREYFENGVPGLCTSCRTGNLVGRNFDWAYDDLDEFIVRVPAQEGRHASLGVVNEFFPEKLQDFVVLNSILPMLTMDGINDAGVAVNVNIVVNDTAGNTTGTNPGAERLCAGFVPRFVLDNADSAAHAVQLLQSRSIFSIITQEFHWMISDATETYIVECVDNQLAVLRKSASEGDTVMANFHVTRSPHCGEYDAVVGEGLMRDEYTDNPLGVERYDMAREGLGSVKNQQEMLDHMEKTWYTQVCQPGNERRFWSEMNEDTYIDEAGNERYFTYYDGPELDEVRYAAFADYQQTYREVMAREARTGWRVADGELMNGIAHSTHTCAYDLATKSLLVEVQERETAFAFTLGEETFSNMTTVYVNGDNVGLSCACEEEGAEWSYDAQAKQLTLSGEGPYAVSGLDGSGISVAGKEKIGVSFDIPKAFGDGVSVIADGRPVAGRNGTFTVWKGAKVTVSFDAGNGEAAVLRFRALSDIASLSDMEAALEFGRHSFAKESRFRTAGL